MLAYFIFYTVGTGSFPGVKRSGRGVDHPPPSSAEVKEEVELYLYSPLGLRGLLWAEIYYFSALFYTGFSSHLVKFVSSNLLPPDAKVFSECIVLLHKLRTVDHGNLIHDQQDATYATLGYSHTDY
jgi:hypothetical protein